MCIRERIQRQDQENLSYLCYPLLLKKKILKLTAFIKPDHGRWDSYPGIGEENKSFLLKKNDTPFLFY